MKINHKRILFVFLAPIAYFLNWLAHKNSVATNNIYSQGVYPLLSGVFGRATNIVPLSLAEIIIILLIIFLLVCFVRFIKNIVLRKVPMKSIILKAVSTILAVASCIYFIFIIVCGLNYARPTYGALIGLETAPASTEELKNMCTWIINETNTAKLATMHPNEVFEFSAISHDALALEARDIFNNYGESNPLLGGYTPKAKPVMLSYFMSYTNITGVYFPFTFESNVNIHIPDIDQPSTILHELAHFKGFMKESDANFIAFMVGSQSNNPDYVYSSNMLALSHSLSAYYSVASNEDYFDLYSLISPEVVSDMRNNNDYWKQFETPIADMSEKINDGYLKSNKQPSGTKSYGEMVDTLMAYYNSLGYSTTT